MKKLFIIIAAAAMLASCSKDGGRSIANNPGEAVGFSVYTSSLKTKGTEEGTSTICAANAGQDDGTGFGVFAFYQESKDGIPTYFNSRKLNIPNFMYNQRIFTKSTSSEGWEYSPVKFWPSNGSDRLSFFAYAPYESGKTWGDMSVTTDAAASKLSVSFNIAGEIPSQKDFLWATPVLNKAYSSTSSDIEFNLRHVTAKVGIQVGITVSGGSTPTGITDAYKNTTVEVKNITFSGLHETFTMSYSLSDGAPGTASCSMDGSQSISVTPYISTEKAEYIKVKTPYNHWLSTAVPGVVYYTSEDGETPVQTTEGQSVTSFYILNDYQNNRGYFANGNSHDGWVDYLEDSQYMFLAPQDFSAQKATVSLTYVVKTADAKWDNCTEFTDTATKDLSAIATSGLEAGKAYTLKFLIGMDDVNISTEITGW